MKKGYTPDWKQRIPQNIALGLDTSQPHLLERRKDWNTRTPDAFALPTEIWRETVERLQRCESLLSKISNGEIRHINDFITFNLDIRSFVYDLLRQAPNRLFILHFYKALQQVTILDPTCGSGAFLFAAMNILEPLYEVCIERMQEFNAQNPNWFKTELDEIAHKYRSNIQYFIFKSIILRNLYGVDIMVEATEIAKLRLFLKMMAVVEVDFRADNLGLDPLPDIDFNIRCGNTLVGYATEEELKKDLAYGDMFANEQFREKVETEMQLVSTAYETFKSVQFTQSEDMAAFKQAKHGLNERLASLNELLNHRLHHATTSLPYNDWLASHQPFHWLAEFYQIIHGNGGFDVIIGNPPYVEYSKVKNTYNIKNIKSIDSGNLYAYVIEKSLNISHTDSRNGMIIQMSAFCTPRMKSFQKIWFENAAYASIAFFDDRPGKLFDKLQHIRVAIPILQKGISNRAVATTCYNKFYSQCRTSLFKTLNYYVSSESVMDSSVIKIHNVIEESIVKKVWNKKFRISSYEAMMPNSNFVYYGYGYGYFGKILNYKSFFKGERISESTGDKYYYIEKDKNRDVFVAVMNSSLFYWFYINYSDGHNFTKTVIGDMPFDYWEDTVILYLVRSLMADLEEKSSLKTANYKSTGRVEYREYYPKKSKPIIDEIDKVLAKHYGFTEEELDFIINYDIKYRMGDELNE